MPMPSSLQWNWRFDGYLQSSSDEPSYFVAIYDTKALRTLDPLPFQHGGQGLADDELTVIYAEYDRGNDGIAGTPFWDTFYFIRLDDGTFLGIGTREQGL